MRRFAIGIFAVMSVSLLPALASDRELDLHLSDAAAGLFQRSAFAHGYLHGYEDGFHTADLDIQMGHLLPGVRVKHDDREFKPRYRTEYGDRNLFLLGFKLGRGVGYADSIGGHPFRAISTLREAAAGLGKGQVSALFDRAFYDGYIAGERSGATDALLRSDFSGIGSACQSSRNQKDRDQYCDAYTRGFQVGYSDGRAEKLANTSSVQTAENKK